VNVSCDTLNLVCERRGVKQHLYILRTGYMVGGVKEFEEVSIGTSSLQYSNSSLSSAFECEDCKGIEPTANIVTSFRNG